MHQACQCSTVHEAAENVQVRLASVAENSFNAVERMDEFTNIAEEADANIDGSQPPDWPSAGKVSTPAS